jgi:RimJ/RimL family protein N-acetyltransferase
VLGLLEGKTVNLRVTDKEDLPLFAEWRNMTDFWGGFESILQMSGADLEKMLANLSAEWKWFIVETKDGSKVGFINHRPAGKAQELGYGILPGERRKGYGAEATVIMVDYLFLTFDIVRIQAHTSAGNKASQRVLEKAGFKREGTIRKAAFVRGEWTDSYLYGILREEWKEPKILTRTH